jgi:hypothetical protein
MKIVKSEEAYNVLAEILKILDVQNESNWRDGIKAAMGELVDAGDGINQDGFERARSIYNAMTRGGRGFSEYYILSNNEDERIDANNILDKARENIWSIFNN